MGLPTKSRRGPHKGTKRAMHLPKHLRRKLSHSSRPPVVSDPQELPDDESPRSFVIRMPTIQSNALAELAHNVRRVMMPNTAINLREKKGNKLKDFVAVAGNLSISHFLLFGQTMLHATLRMCHFPQGPSLFFNIQEYSLMKDLIVQNQTGLPSVFSSAEYKNPPLVLLNGFPEDDPISSEQRAISLTATFLQNMFPPIRISSKSSDVKRIVLFHHEDGLIYFRHYRVLVSDKSISRPVRSILHASSSQAATRRIHQTLSKVEDISDLVLDQLETASDAEDTASSSSKRSVKVSEIGPRMTLSLIKIRQGFGDDGTILYHRLSPSE